jgi:hypothetical protein
MSLQLALNPICSSGLETGAAARARSHGRGLLSKSPNVSRNSSPYALHFFELARNTDFLVSGHGTSAMHRGGLEGR